ncbi:uncharacterized protein C8Q71DRAFT_721027 [Rhodofomes roseus]|uniref:Uncharacterized protein n=1 Tax=Rhodofomes roseus TaxID=34475 RepID=A0ABQ8KT79_9APHY|nr:uncharacterized protein C8Q71DRAFT_721027 [Rhodofomes roseus]KAH9841989.1 hypothetical protein C8Q71DRAFT_721027 [Rhodofomes roseus]
MYAAHPTPTPTMYHALHAVPVPGSTSLAYALQAQGPAQHTASGRRPGDTIDTYTATHAWLDARSWPHIQNPDYGVSYASHGSGVDGIQRSPIASAGHEPVPVTNYPAPYTTSGMSNECNALWIWTSQTILYHHGTQHEHSTMAPGRQVYWAASYAYATPLLWMR